MNLGEFADVLTRVLIAFRNTAVVTEILPRLNGQTINDETVRQLLLPVVGLLMNEVPTETQLLVTNRFKEFVPVAMEAVRRNDHMHSADETGLMNQANADAILTCFGNHLAAPLDLALYASDLTPTPTPVP